MIQLVMNELQHPGQGVCLCDHALRGMSALATMGPMFWIKSAQAQTSFKPEKGAKLRVLRWKRFVQPDEDMWLANTKKFSEKYGIPVRTDNENWEDVRPKAAVASSAARGASCQRRMRRRAAPRLRAAPSSWSWRPTG